MMALLPEGTPKKKKKPPQHIDHLLEGIKILKKNKDKDGLAAIMNYITTTVRNAHEAGFTDLAKRYDQLYAANVESYTPVFNQTNP